MEKCKLKPFDVEAFKNGAIALSKDKSLLARYVDALYKPGYDAEGQMFVVYFPWHFVFIEQEEREKLLDIRLEADIVTRDGWFIAGSDRRDLCYLVDGLTLLDIPEFVVSYYSF